MLIYGMKQKKRTTKSIYFDSIEMQNDYEYEDDQTNRRFAR